jgi:hypothetical protein
MKYRTYTKEQMGQVKKLFEDGKNQCEISRITGIPRGTLKSWLIPTYKRITDKPRNNYIPITDFDEYLDTPEKRAAYSFILAVYLCDGVISRFKTFRVPSMRLFNDSKYPKNTSEWAEKLKIIFPENSVNVHKRPRYNCNVVLLYSRKLLDLFPQYGNGRKHTRKLVFADWQKKIVQEFPEEFIRGCIQSDGCIYNQKVNGKVYPRYAFTNMSEDIIDMLLWSLSLVGIEKAKWQNKTNKKFVVQNFRERDFFILQGIINKKE